MTAKSYLVTGGTGFIGSALARRLVHAGRRVRVLDNNSRGSADRLQDIAEEIDFVAADIRDPHAVLAAATGVDAVCHLAFVNGTEFFYSKPYEVLDVGVRGMINVLDACRHHDIPELILASSSEVYQTPPVIPTDEAVPLSIPDPLNPRYSYAGGKIISELMVLNYGHEYLQRVLIFRPHNVFGPNMGFEHVIPQFILRLHQLSREHPHDPIPFTIQGTGIETRAFVYIDDFTDGLMLVLEKGAHRNIYHIGTRKELAITDVAHAVAETMGRRIEIVPGPAAPGGTTRRCPDITKLTQLGYQPKFTLRQGLAHTIPWYVEDAACNQSSDRSQALGACP